MNAALAPAVTACARCAVIQETCCQRAEVVVTRGDVERIARHTGDRSFVERRVPVDPAYLEADDDDPDWLRYTVRADGTRRVLRRRSSGACTFLGTAGCTLPASTRPLVCRLYPHAYTETQLDGVDSEYCPTAILSPDRQPMTAVLGISVEDAEAWRRQLYEELRHGEP
jgi:Fe-S-cluster containining protein